MHPFYYDDNYMTLFTPRRIVLLGRSLLTSYKARAVSGTDDDKMRLINAKTLELEDFTLTSRPKYAILSHTWGVDEVLHQDMVTPERTRKYGWNKIVMTCQVALKDNIDYVWMDTCCIDKSSSAELTEAINSMFQWYRDAAVCYAYLVDLKTTSPSGNSLFGCRWWTRGWTLQELIAPKKLIFYNSAWTSVGSKFDLRESIQARTRIPVKVLQNDFYTYMTYDVAFKMSWAAKRQTTRIEDRAYCLLGLLGVNMPLLYGEGEKAFYRLQEEVVKGRHDLSILAFGHIFNSSVESGEKTRNFTVTHGSESFGQMFIAAKTLWDEPCYEDYDDLSAEGNKPKLREEDYERMCNKAQTRHDMDGSTRESRTTRQTSEARLLARSPDQFRDISQEARYRLSTVFESDMTIMNKQLKLTGHIPLLLFTSEKNGEEKTGYALYCRSLVEGGNYIFLSKIASNTFVRTTNDVYWGPDPLPNEFIYAKSRDAEIRIILDPTLGYNHSDLRLYGTALSWPGQSTRALKMVLPQAPFDHIRQTFLLDRVQPFALAAVELEVDLKATGTTFRDSSWIRIIALFSLNGDTLGPPEHGSEGEIVGTGAQVLIFHASHHPELNQYIFRSKRTAVDLDWTELRQSFGSFLDSVYSELLLRGLRDDFAQDIRINAVYEGQGDITTGLRNKKICITVGRG